MTRRAGVRDVAEVFIWGARVGAVAWNPVKHTAAFEYDEDWIRAGVEPSPLTLPLRSGVSTFPELAGSWFQGMPGLVAASLPGRFGLGVIRQWLRCRNDDADLSPVGQLRFVGSGGAGALEFRPERPMNRPANSVSIDGLADSVRTIEDAGGSALALDNKRLTDLLAAADLGSHRPRASIDWLPPSGPIRPLRNEWPEAAESWLVTFAKDELEAKVEYAYSLMAADAEVDVPRCRLFVDSSEWTHFMRRRFDRTSDGKVHVQSLAALRHFDPDIPGAHSYEQALSTAQALGVGAAGVTQLYTRMVFNVAAANQNDTTTKVAFTMNPTGEWVLAPAFDLTWAPSPTRHHQMTVNGKSVGITAKDLREVGRRFGIRDTGRIIDTVASAVAAWAEYAAYAQVPPDTQKDIGATHQVGF